MHACSAFILKVEQIHSYIVHVHVSVSSCACHIQKIHVMYEAVQLKKLWSERNFLFNCWPIQSSISWGAVTNVCIFYIY